MSDKRPKLNTQPASKTSYLEHIHTPADVKRLRLPELQALCEELRRVLIDTVSKNGGHLSSNLGVVELTVALHRALDLPHDQIVWDVGHQCYVHKLLTGRADRFDTLRTEGGLSGFPRPCESPYDVFVAGHSSTSVSAANGMAKAKALLGDDGYVVAVIGDGALTGGLAYEGLSNAGRSKDRLIVVLNDNRMSISKNVGFVARHLASLRARPRYVRFKAGLQKVLTHIPLVGRPLYQLLLSAKSRLKTLMYRNSTLFEEMGFYYLGPIDGHNLTDLTNAMETAKNIGRPVLLHVETIKGHGCHYATQNPDTYHGVAGFDAATGRTPCAEASFSSVAGDTLCDLARQDGRICAITAAMKSGTGLSTFAEQFSARFFDVGIAEEHAVTFASGLAQNGMLPVFAVYATFLQRCYDQLLNDTSIINSHIVLAIDRAGVVPDDGETHQGIFDVPFLCTIPNVTIYAPACFEELRLHLRQALYDVDGIAAVRYPKACESALSAAYTPSYRSYTLFAACGMRTLLVTYGRLAMYALKAADLLRKSGEEAPAILKLNRVWPLESSCVALTAGYDRVLFFEEGSRSGGIGEHLGARLLENGFSGSYELHALEGFVGTCKADAALHHAGLDAEGMARALRGEPPVGERS